MTIYIIKTFTILIAVLTTVSCQKYKEGDMYNYSLVMWNINAIASLKEMTMVQYDGKDCTWTGIATHMHETI